MIDRCLISRHGKRLVRIEVRPHPADWRDDEMLSLPEAACLFFPRGPLGEKSLRNAAQKGQLGVVLVASKLFTTPGAIKAMIRPVTASPSAGEGSARNGQGRRLAEGKKNGHARETPPQIAKETAG
jgi:hypothetical protein